ncbi:MAG: class I SAM-dependent methyltransferase [Clostridia bacterium]|nr:class I SAM-dependent methyltransferase [Clostridia bacterium]
MANNAYQALAEWFEYLNDDCGYEQWSQYLLSLLQSYHAGKTGLDIGCGSGYFTRALHRAGYLVTGMDCSQAMLSKAQELSRDEGLNIPFIFGDATAFKLPGKVDFALAINDCFNYIPPQKLLTAFQKTAKALTKDGLFFFDISSEHKLKNLPPVSIDDREDVTYFAFNRIQGQEVTMDVTLFVKNGGMPTYSRQDERHTQFIHTEREVESCLKDAGFELIFCLGHLGEDKKDAQRLEFLARRK